MARAASMLLLCCCCCCCCCAPVECFDILMTTQAASLLGRTTVGLQHCQWCTAMPVVTTQPFLGCSLWAINGTPAWQIMLSDRLPTCCMCVCRKANSCCKPRVPCPAYGIGRLVWSAQAFKSCLGVTSCIQCLGQTAGTCASCLQQCV